MAAMKLLPGEKISSRKLESLEQGWIDIPDVKATTHLQFRRFAGCPFCNVHLNTFIQRHNELVAAGILEVVVFRSTAAALRRHHGNAPFAIIADPRGALYDAYGVGYGWRALGHPRTLLMALPKIVQTLPHLPGLPRERKAALGLPADFLIRPDGNILACKYGEHADDQWSVDELFGILARHAP